MTRQEAIEILKAKLTCMERDMRGTDENCNERNCLNCDLNYKQGTMGEQMEVLQMAIDALEFAQPKYGYWTESHEHVYMGNVGKEWTNWYCSECDAPNDKPTDFCPSCGADMRGKQDE